MRWERNGDWVNSGPMRLVEAREVEKENKRKCINRGIRRRGMNIKRGEPF